MARLSILRCLYNTLIRLTSCPIATKIVKKPLRYICGVPVKGGKKAWPAVIEFKIVSVWLTSTKISTQNSTTFLTDLALWPNGKAFDFESKDSGFDPQRDHQL